MSEGLPPEASLVRAEAIRGASGPAWLIGAVIGGVSGFVTMGTMVFGMVCCILQVGTVLVPGLAGMLAGLVAAGRPVYAGLAAGEGLWVGAAVGARSGASAALFSSFGPLLMVAVGLAYFVGTGTVGSGELLGTAVAVGAWGTVTAGGMLLGVVLGAASGAVVGELRQPLVSRELPEPR
jgi:hypothetical protein